VLAVTPEPLPAAQVRLVVEMAALKQVLDQAHPPIQGAAAVVAAVLQIMAARVAPASSSSATLAHNEAQAAR
jgi:hypothetical protein